MSKISYDEAVKLGFTKRCAKCYKVKSVVEFSRKKVENTGLGLDVKSVRLIIVNNTVKSIKKK